MATFDNKRSVPCTVVLDGARLCKIRERLQHGDESLNAVLAQLTASADLWLHQGPWSVVSKEKMPPSGNYHDYVSQAPYWWPSDVHGQMPYVRRDGEVNPETLKYPDKANLAKVFQSSFVLSLAWFYTRKEEYSKHASNILRTWFLAPGTRMNPNLNHAQLIPGANTGRAIGIIDFSQQFTSILDAVGILATGAPGWTRDDADAFRSWNVEFLDWLCNSPFGKQESQQKNNHGTYAAVQKAAISLFLGDQTKCLEEIKILQTRINAEISADGSQLQELSRTRSWHYSCFNLAAYTRAACIARKMDIDLWMYKGPDGQSINKAIDFLIPAATGTSNWHHPEIKFLRFAAYDIIKASAEAGNMKAKDAEGKLQKPHGEDLWGDSTCPRLFGQC